jgi:hypothetical protein
VGGYSLTQEREVGGGCLRSEASVQTRLSLCDPEFLASLCVFNLQVPQPPQEMWHMWQGDVLQVTLANQIADSKPDSGIAKPSAVSRLVSLGPSLRPGL